MGEPVRTPTGRMSIPAPRASTASSLVATGALSALTVRRSVPARWFPDVEAMARELDGTLGADAVLIKGSRSNRPERAVDALVGERKAGRGKGAVLARQGTDRGYTGPNVSPT